MTPQSVRFFDGHKFLWDGETYDSRAAAEAKKSDYEAEQFETQLIEEEGKFLVHTRRVVKEVKVESEPPPA
jgi:hypothetical protein